MKKWMVAGLLAAAWPQVWACSAMPPEQALAAAADADGNGAVSAQEWAALADVSRTDNLLLSFPAGSRLWFARLDADGDGQLRGDEWYGVAGKTAYLRHPCEGWEAAQRQRLLPRSRFRQPETRKTEAQ